MADNLLDILTRADRPKFTIDGKSYEIRHPNELSMAEFHQFYTHGDALVQAGEAYSKDPEGAFESIQKTMDALLDLVTPDLPAKVREKLNPSHVQQICEAFMGLVRIKPAPGERPNRKKSSRGSPASTRARRRRTG